MIETPRHKKAFEYYVGLEGKRTLSAVSAKFKVSAPTMTKWRKEFKWDERVQKRDEKNAAAIARRTDSDIVKRDAQNVKIAREAIKVFAVSLVGYVEHTCKCGEVIRLAIPKVKMTADQFDKMVRLEKFIMGEEAEVKPQLIIIQHVDPEPRRKPVESKEIE